MMDKLQQVKRMHRTYFFIITCLAALCAFLAFYSIRKDAQIASIQENLSIHEPETLHPVSPFKSYISATGVVEASSENIFIGTPLNRIVDKVFVTVGQPIQKNDPLIQFENRDLEATLQAQQTAYQIAEAKLKKLEALPRKEDLLSAESSLQSVQVELSQAKHQYEMTQGLRDPRALSQEEINRRRFNYEQAEAKSQQAKANLEKVKAGTWQPDKEIAYLQTLQAKANVERAKVDLERTLIRSPIEGKVLQIKIHPGELPSNDPSRLPMMVIGNTDEKHLEVSINQFNAPYFRPDAPAVAFLQGNSNVEFHLEFLKLEPYLVNKQTITNNISEKVDTRVLRVTYRFKENDRNIFVGQAMDVFIEADYTP